MCAKSHLHHVLDSHQFAVTCEIGPPKSADASVITGKAELLKGYADAYNITDNQTAVVRLSSLAGSIIVQQEGMEPILQLACRDRNRIALQSDVLGAVSLGVKNMLFITGDHQSVGNHPQAKGVFDVDSLQLVSIAKKMRDEGMFQNGEPLKKRFSDLFIGSVINPFATPHEYRVMRLEKKIHAGSDFVQTQSVFNLDRFQRFMEEVVERGLDSKIFILAGVTPIKSVRMLDRMKYHVPGVDIPDDMYERLVQADDFQKESYQVSCEIISALKKMKGVDGIHITALFWESIIPSLVQDNGLYPRP